MTGEADGIRHDLTVPGAADPQPAEVDLQWERSVFGATAAHYEWPSRVMQAFVNPPKQEQAKATEVFFTKLGHSFDRQFTDENAARMIISEDSSACVERGSPWPS